MKRLWAVPVLLFLALALRAQDDGKTDSPPDIQGSEDKAPAADGDAAPADSKPDEAPAEAPAESPAPAAEGGDNAGDSGGDNGGDKASKEEPIISIKPATPMTEEPDEESVAPAAEPKRVVPTATLTKPKKGRPAKGSKTAKGSKKGKAAAPAPVKAKAPALPAEAPPPPPPAVPLTPITPRNP